MSVPLAPNNESFAMPEIEALNLDFWSSEIKKNGVYAPKIFKSK